MATRDRPALRIIAGLDQAVRHSRGDLQAPEHAFQLPARSGQERGSDPRRAPTFQPLDYDARPQRRSTLERIADAMGSPRFLLFYCGFYAGCLMTVGLAFLWSRGL